MDDKGLTLVSKERDGEWQNCVNHEFYEHSFFPFFLRGVAWYLHSLDLLSTWLLCVVSNFHVKISKFWCEIRKLDGNFTNTWIQRVSRGSLFPTPLTLGGVRVPPSANGSSEHDCQGKINVRGLVEPWNAVYKRPNLLMQCNTVVVSLLISVCTQRDGAVQSVAEQCIVHCPIQCAAQCSSYAVQYQP